MAMQTDNPRWYSTASARRGWWIVISSVVILILAAAALAAAAAYRISGGGGHGASRALGIERRLRIGELSGLQKGTAANGQTRKLGVVTAVNGSNFTLAANGETTQVATSSSTQYRGGSQVKADDTVIAAGTISNGTLDASRVNINPHL